MPAKKSVSPCHKIPQPDLMKLYDQAKTHILQSWAYPRLMVETEPLVIGGEGAYFYDAKGKKYLDFMAQLYDVNVGMNNRTVIEAIKKQLDKLAYVAPSFPTEPKIKLAKRLAEITSGNLCKTFFSNSGTEAVEAAIKLTRIYMEPRYNMIGLWKAYHGSTYGSLSAGGSIAIRPMAGPPLPGFYQIPPPYCYRCYFGLEYPDCKLRCAGFLRDTIEFIGPETIAGFIGETIVGSAGILVPPKEYWPEIRRICDHYKIVEINDEVMTGFGRTGKMFGYENYEIIPDIITVAKGLTSGYIPLGATIMGKHIGDHFAYPPYFMHSYTFSGHAVACAAALAVIDVYIDRKLPQNAAKVGKYLVEALKRIQDRHPSIGDVRGIGLFIAVEFVKDKATREPFVPKDPQAPPDQTPLTTLCNFCLKNGLSIGKALGKDPIVRITPPLIINENDVDEAMEVFEKGVAHIERKFLKP